MSRNELTKRMRVFAGPNGSGKSTIIREIEKSYKTGVYVNADDIEVSARHHGRIHLADFHIQSNEDQFEKYFQQSTLRLKAESEGFPVRLLFSLNSILVKSTRRRVVKPFIFYIHGISAH